MNKVEVINAIVSIAEKEYEIAESIVTTDEEFMKNHVLSKESYDALCLVFRSFVNHVAYVWWINTEKNQALHEDAGTIAWSNVSDKRLYDFITEQYIVEGLTGLGLKADVYIFKYVIKNDGKGKKDINSMLKAAGAMGL